MLLLTRRIGETITIGDDISFTILGINGNQVKLGINAPADVPVHRLEVYQRILMERNDRLENQLKEGEAA